MSLIITEKENIVAIADAIRSKTNTDADMTLGEMAQGVANISGGAAASVDTCAVEVCFDTEYSNGGYYREPAYVVASTYVDGKVSTYYCETVFATYDRETDKLTTTTLTIPNVICGTSVTIFTHDDIDEGITKFALDCSDGVVPHNVNEEYVASWYFTVNASAGETVTLGLFARYNEEQGE